MKSIQVAVAICIAALQLPTSSANPFFVNDDRVRDLGVTPVLGRGFSLMTNTFLATCMESTETTTPSYNYDREYIWLLVDAHKLTHRYIYYSPNPIHFLLVHSSISL